MEKKTKFAQQYEKFQDGLLALRAAQSELAQAKRAKAESGDEGATVLVEARAEADSILAIAEAEATALAADANDRLRKAEATLESRFAFLRQFGTKLETTLATELREAIPRKAPDEVPPLEADAAQAAATES